ncbi:hypothetical protein BDY21DRAFT_112530 [Lineolata rhizophorae]|uniref:Uncharacterized protein n=1 Tax=Lineolata rhizophorae TaxID=578093 RepID=A0A6A6NQY1_9PEZI|nr:hypothetical protein BDY21DRAFT_112530 [Lineolata rhizophorae]
MSGRPTSSPWCGKLRRIGVKGHLEAAIHRAILRLERSSGREHGFKGWRRILPPGKVTSDGEIGRGRIRRRSFRSHEEGAAKPVIWGMGNPKWFMIREKANGPKSEPEQWAAQPRRSRAESSSDRIPIGGKTVRAVLTCSRDREGTIVGRTRTEASRSKYGAAEPPVRREMLDTAAVATGAAKRSAGEVKLEGTGDRDSRRRKR